MIKDPYLGGPHLNLEAAASLVRKSLYAARCPQDGPRNC
jgi:hypothetical protein